MSREPLTAEVAENSPRTQQGSFDYNECIQSSRIGTEMAAAPEAPELATEIKTDKPRTANRAAALFSAWVRDLVISLAIAAFIIVFLYQPVKVEGTSMMPSLDDQERIFINKFVYRIEPIQHGDIIVFRYPRDPSKSFIKRVIGVAGDRVRDRRRTGVPERQAAAGRGLRPSRVPG